MINQRLENKIIIVTGGNGLLGKSIINRLLLEGAFCINFDVNHETTPDLSKIKGQVVNDLPKSKSVPEIDIQIVDSLNFEGKGKKINNSKDQ